jgi:hypothetical protein
MEHLFELYMNRKALSSQMGEIFWGNFLSGKTSRFSMRNASLEKVTIEVTLPQIEKLLW